MIFEKNISKDKMDARIKDLQLKGFSNFETTLKHKNGNDICVEIKVLVINYNNQPALMNITRDITHRKIAEQALKESEEKYRQIVNKSSDVIWTQDMALKTTYMSQSVERILGLYT